MKTIATWSVLAALLPALIAGAACAADVEVIDGGRLRIDGRETALWGLTAPAAAEFCVTRAGKPWPCGRRAREQVRAVIEGEDVRCAPKAPGLAVCRVAGLDLGALLVKEGLAKAKGDYDALEQRAREAGVGLWE